MGLFGSNRDEEAVRIDSEEESNSKLTSITNYLGSVYNKRISTPISSALETSQNYQLGIVVLVVGFALLLMSFFFIPFILLSPYKFCTLYAFGVATIFAGLYFIRGVRLIKNLFKREKVIYTLIFLVSLVGEILFSVVRPSYVMTIIMLMFNLVGLIYLVATLIPGGTRVIDGGLRMGAKGVWSVTKSVVGNGGSILPL